MIITYQRWTASQRGEGRVSGARFKSSLPREEGMMWLDIALPLPSLSLETLSLMWSFSSEQLSSCFANTCSILASDKACSLFPKPRKCHKGTKGCPPRQHRSSRPRQLLEGSIETPGSSVPHTVDLITEPKEFI